MAALIDGGDGVDVGVAGLNIRVVIAGTDDGLRGRDALPGGVRAATRLSRR